MENLILSANIVLPLFVIMGLGYAAKQLKLIDYQVVRKMNNLVFRVFVPIMICNNIMSADAEAEIQWNVFLFAVIGIFIVFALSFLIIPRIEKENAKRGVLIQGIGRGNYVLFGLPLVNSICPDTFSAVPAMLVLVAVPMFNVLSVIALETYRGEKTNFKKIAKGIITNPLILGSILGFILLKLQLPLPHVITKPMDDITQMATPIALFMLGSSFDFSKVGQNFKQLTIGVAGKLIISPLIFVSLAVLLGFRGVELASIMVVFAAPTAVNSYTMAQQMGGDENLASAQVVFSSLLSIFTIFGMVYIGMHFGWFA